MSAQFCDWRPGSCPSVRVQPDLTPGPGKTASVPSLSEPLNSPGGRDAPISPGGFVRTVMHSTDPDASLHHRTPRGLVWRQRLALQELEAATPPTERPVFWISLWERYVESQVDYRANSQTLAGKLGEAGADAWQLLGWLGEPAQAQRMAGVQWQLLKRVFGEQFDVVAGKALPQPEEKQLIEETTQSSQMAQAQESGSTSAPVAETAAETAVSSALRQPTASPEADRAQTEFPGQLLASAAVEPKGKGELSSNRVQNPHDPEATYAVKGQGQQKKEHVGYKVQVAQSVSEVALADGEPTGNFIVGIVTHAAHESDELGAEMMEQEQMGLDKPPVQYADGA